MSYRYLARSVGGFIQQAAVYYVQRGYYFYVLGRVQKGNCCRQIDRKILAKYGIEISKDQRYRHKKKGQANIQYLRYQDTFLLLATEGEHPFFAEEKTAIQDARVSPLRVFGYTITYKKGRVLVGLDEETYRHLKADFLHLALRRTPHTLAWKFCLCRSSLTGRCIVRCFPSARPSTASGKPLVSRWFPSLSCGACGGAIGRSIRNQMLGVQGAQGQFGS